MEEQRGRRSRRRMPHGVGERPATGARGIQVEAAALQSMGLLCTEGELPTAEDATQRMSSERHARLADCSLITDSSMAAQAGVLSWRLLLIFTVDQVSSFPL
ncbi:hypothetical protein VPH35_052051 [Triticum aestivum]